MLRKVGLKRLAEVSTPLCRCCPRTAPRTDPQVIPHSSVQDLPCLAVQVRAGCDLAFLSQGLVLCCPRAPCLHGSAKLSLPEFRWRTARGWAGCFATDCSCCWLQVCWRVWGEPPAKTWLLFPLSHICLVFLKQIEKLACFRRCRAESCAQAAPRFPVPAMSNLDPARAKSLDFVWWVRKNKGV